MMAKVQKSHKCALIALYARVHINNPHVHDVYTYAYMYNAMWQTAYINLLIHAEGLHFRSSLCKYSVNTSDSNYNCRVQNNPDSIRPNAYVLRTYVSVTDTYVSMCWSRCGMFD